MVSRTTSVAAVGSPTFAGRIATSPSMPSMEEASILRETIITLAPDSANVLAMARPIPRDAPVTRATLPLSEISIREN